jgi:HPt (histidine-containing phosphotransfer) domain-containing protein
MSYDLSTPVPDKLSSQLLADDADLRDVVEEFVNSLDERVREMQSAYEKLDWDLLTMLAHRLKGAGGSYGYPDLSALGAQMEQQFKAHQAAEFEACAQRFSRFVAAAKAGLS